MELDVVFLTLAALFLIGLVADQLGRRTRLPRVTLLLACGVAVGRSGFDLLPVQAQEWYDFLAITALTMVAFLLGGALTRENLQGHGRAILMISGAVVLVTLTGTAALLWAVGVNLSTALILAAIATAPAPAATQDVIHQAGAKGPFTDTLAGIVAIEDAWGLMAFSLVLALVITLGGSGAGAALGTATREIGGALVLGAAIGFPAAYLTGRLLPGEPLQTEALIIVFLTAGLSIWLETSFLIAGMTAGAIVVNRARHHSRAFHEIENIQWPFMVLFFVLAGASFEVETLTRAGFIGSAYVLLRILSRLAGGWIGAALGRAPRVHRRWFGVALMPQAGVAVGMALVASRLLPVQGEIILTLTVATTVVFELIGPAGTLMALRAVGEVPDKPEGRSEDG